MTVVQVTVDLLSTTRTRSTVDLFPTTRNNFTPAVCLAHCVRWSSEARQMQLANVIAQVQTQNRAKFRNGMNEDQTQNFAERASLACIQGTEATKPPT